MDSTHLHFLLNHFPILGTLFGFCLLAYGLLRKNISLENAGLVTLVIITVLTIPVFLTGEGAEETVEHLQGVSEYYIEQHEEAAELALWLMITTGALALIALVISLIRKSRGILLKIIVLLFAAGTLGVMVLVGSYGGKIRHSELRDKVSNQVDNNTGGAEYDHDEDDDED